MYRIMSERFHDRELTTHAQLNESRQFQDLTWKDTTVQESLQIYNLSL